MTKYQGKQMEALTLLFRSMTGGVHRLEEQEREEEQQAQATAAGDEEHATKKRRIHEDLAKRARRPTVRFPPWQPLLLAVRYRSRGTPAHWLRLLADAQEPAPLHQAAAMGTPRVQAPV